VSKAGSVFASDSRDRERSNSRKLGGRLRLSGEVHFRSLLASKRRAHGERFSIQARSNGLPYARLGIVAGRRAVARSVDRSFAKRLVRERFRHNRDKLAGLDVLVRLRRKVARTEGSAAGDELSALFYRISQ